MAPSAEDLRFIRRGVVLFGLAAAIALSGAGILGLAIRVFQVALGAG